MPHASVPHSLKLGGATALSTSSGHPSPVGLLKAALSRDQDLDQAEKAFPGKEVEITVRRYMLAQEINKVPHLSGLVCVEQA